MDIISLIKFSLNKLCLLDLKKISRHIYTKVGELDAEFFNTDEPVPFSEKNKYPLLRINRGNRWGELFDCGWFHFTGRLNEKSKGKKVVLSIALDGEGCLFDEQGTPLRGLSNISSPADAFEPRAGKRFLDVTENANGDELIDIWVEAGHNKLSTNIKPFARLKEKSILTVREDVKALFYDFLYLGMKYVRTQIPSIRIALKNCMQIVSDYSEENVQRAIEVLEKELKNGTPTEFKIYSVGHAHLDLAWLWPIRETKRKAGRTFSTAIYNLEKYPDFYFGGSQPQQFQWIKDAYPKLFEKIQAYVEKGRFELQGGMWVEADTNLSGGESLIRQSLYGQAFWEKEFGKVSDMVWLPDVFGFSGNIPQIAKKCGMPYLITTKLSWNKTNKFPHRSFIWKGIDGSDLLVHMPPEGNYNSDASYISLTNAFDNYPEKETVKTFGMMYGVGDGGGGPGTVHIENALHGARQNDKFKVILSPMREIFNELENYRGKLSEYTGELYLETHRGTYTTQARNKRYNRKIEYLLHNVEFLSTVAHVKNGYDYPFAALDRIWKEVLLYQFHDIIPGSSIGRVYAESISRYKLMTEELEKLKAKALEALSTKESIHCVINTTSFTRTECLTLDGNSYIATVAPFSTAKLLPYNASDKPQQSNEKMENESFYIEFSPEGEISKLIEKASGFDYCGEYLNRLNVYHDKRRDRYEAWNIDYKYLERAPQKPKVVSVKQFSDGESIIRETEYTYGKSKMTQRVKLSSKKNYVEFNTIVDWRETRKMLRADFLPSVYSDRVTCDIQFGSISRSTRNDTSVEKAQFEICAHKWVDVSDKDKGFAVLNDCKYGHRVKEGIISLNLLRSPNYPDPTADRCVHEFSYAIYPHKGDHVESNVASVGYSLNIPLLLSKNAIELPSFVSTDKPTVIVETVKLSEDGKGVILRIYENSGKPVVSNISIDMNHSEVLETDMLENVIQSTSLEALSFSPFEIKTLKVIR